MKSLIDLSRFQYAEMYGRRLVLGVALPVVLAMGTGCGSGSSGTRLGNISVTDPSGAITGQLTSVAINAKAAVSVAVSQDSKNLGVNWVATCGGSPISPPGANPCGTIAPAYVGSSANIIYTAPAFIPVATTVQLTASATSDPSVTSSTTISIAPLPITIALTLPPPASLGLSATVALSATVTNDLVAAGVNWKATCGSADCGTLKSTLPVPTQTASGGQINYTAPKTIPSGGTVTLTASSISDATKQVSATVTIAPIAVTATPTAASVAVGTTATITAAVTFDSANAGVDWAAPVCGTAGACGSIAPTHTASGAPTIYTAPASIPAGTTVTLTVSSSSSPAATAKVVLTITPPPPIVVSVLPATAQAQVGGSAPLVATVLNDLANLGVDWTLTCGSAGACGSISTHGTSGLLTTYVAPATAIPTGGTVTATAASTADKTKTAGATITIVPAISLAFSPAPPASVTAGTPASFSATVTNDINAAGVDFTVTCGNPPCGSFSGNGHAASGATIAYTAPIGMAAGTVTITATSTASNSALPVRSVSTSVTIVPVIALNFVPYPPTQVQQSDSTVLTPVPVALVAAVVNDTTNGGVDWSVCGTPATCGQFQVTPALAATATTAALNATYASTVHTASGQAALYVPPSSPPSAGSVSVTAKAHNPLAISLAGTKVATINVVKTPAGVPLQGQVLAGVQPANGASVYLYAAGTTGYSSAATPLALVGALNSVTTTSSGKFSIPAGYACPAQTSQMYLVSVGGNAGGGLNPNLALITALGSCGGLSSAVSLTINEVTTIASVWALAPFMSDYGHLGSSSSNATTGLANAFATVNNLVDVTSGQALVATPAGNSVVPRAEINTLAAILNTCTATAGGAAGDGSKCSALFSAANPGAIASTAPVNTAQAALNIAQVPSYNTTPGAGSIYSLLPASPAFTPVLASAPNDWTIVLSFTGGGLATRSAASALAIDGNGSVWITNSRFSSLTLFTNQGAPLSPTGTGTVQATAGGYQGGGLTFPVALTIDPYGNAWVANSSSLSEVPANIPYTYSGALSGSGFSGGGLGSQVKGIASDGGGNLWAVTGGSPGALSWFAGANTTINGKTSAPGTALSPPAGFTQGIDTPSGAIGLDTAGTVWLLNSGTNSAAEYASATGSFIQNDYGYTETVPIPINSVLSSGVGTSLVIDNPGNVFLSPGTQIVQLKAGGSQANSGGLGSASAANGVNYSQFLALDGLGRIWLLITGGSTNCVSAYSVAQLGISGAQLNVNALGCGYLGAGVNASDVGIAVDGSGSVWVLNSSSLTQLIGVASPVATPFSTGIANKTLDKRP